MSQPRIQWSKIKKRMTALICPELRNRIGLHLTAYREASNECGEGWVTVDGTKIFGCSYLKHITHGGSRVGYGTWDRSLDDRQNHLNWLEGIEGHEFTSHERLLRDNGIHSTREFVLALRIYPTLSVKQALHLTHPLWRAFAIIDRRLGRRSLERFPSTHLQHPLVKRFYELRLQTIREK